MINGAHAILYSDDADATRATLAKVLGTRSVDAGGGWLIFALPPAEVAVHPAEEGGRAELYLMTDDVAATVAALRAEGIEVARPVSDQGWGLLTAIALPGGVELGLYQRATRPRRSRAELSRQTRSHRSPPAPSTGLQHPPWLREATTSLQGALVNLIHAPSQRAGDHRCNREWAVTCLSHSAV
jgi:hypothetical protein